MPTNVELVTRLMEYPKSGPLMQAMVLQALDQFACMVLASEPGSLESPMVSEASWRACAEELRESLSSHMRREA